MFEMFPDVVNVTQLCKMLGVGKKTGYALIHEQKIPYRRIGREYKIPKDAIIEYIHGK